jgi:demethylmenaquinone methyltransferase/2-methoxy-6-polyprenyl-1,4-benzoquinol methylase
MTAGLHHRWRERAADLAALAPGDRALDVATGTGDLAIEAASRGAEVIGSDFSEGMLERARVKAPAITFEQGDALALPYDDNAFDAATVGFGARNFADLEQGLREMTRVVRPGGKVVVLEITTPQRPPLSTFFSLWFDRIVPLVGRVAGDPDAYSYLPNSVKRFPGPEGLAATMERAGLRDIRWILTAGGIIALHVGTPGG